MVAIYGVIMAIVFSAKITGNLEAGTVRSLVSQQLPNRSRTLLGRVT